jgi:tetratricopeptide (TPR) repeat protein
VNITGLGEKEVAQRVAEAQKPLAEQLEKLAFQVARDKGVEIAPIRAILIKMGDAGFSDEDIPKRLNGKADELIKLREEIAGLRQAPANLASFAEKAETLINKGDLDGARAALAEARTTARTLREESSRYEAQFLGQEARVDQLQLAYRSASTKYAEAARLVERFDQGQQLKFLLAQAGVLYQQGQEFGENPPLAEAINVYRDSLLLTPPAQRPEDWAATQNTLGVTLQTLGERETGTAKLEEAVTAYREALKEYTPERTPFDWAATQNNLGNALTTLGTALQTLGDIESGSAKLEEAVVAFHEALKERTRARVPLAWATTQSNLGNALQTLGERERGTAKLEEAVAAYGEALKEYTPERDRPEWAKAQHNLGNALTALGEREGARRASKRPSPPLTMLSRKEPAIASR